MRNEDCRRYLGVLASRRGARPEDLLNELQRHEGVDDMILDQVLTYVAGIGHTRSSVIHGRTPAWLAEHVEGLMREKLKCVRCEAPIDPVPKNGSGVFLKSVRVNGMQITHNFCSPKCYFGDEQGASLLNHLLGVSRSEIPVEDTMSGNKGDESWQKMVQVAKKGVKDEGDRALGKIADAAAQVITLQTQMGKVVAELPSMVARAVQGALREAPASTAQQDPLLEKLDRALKLLEQSPAASSSEAVTGADLAALARQITRSNEQVRSMQDRTEAALQAATSQIGEVAETLTRLTTLLQHVQENSTPLATHADVQALETALTNQAGQLRVIAETVRNGLTQKELADRSSSDKPMRARKQAKPEPSAKPAKSAAVPKKTPSQPPEVVVAKGQKLPGIILPPRYKSWDTKRLERWIEQTYGRKVVLPRGWDYYESKKTLEEAISTTK